MADLIFSFNTVAPVFLLVGIGWFAKKIKLIDDHFIRVSSSLNFKTGLPALLFINIYNATGGNIFDWKFISFMAAGCLGICLILALALPRFIKDPRKVSAITHAVFKPNIIVLGFPLAQMAFGADHVTAISMLMPVLVPINNIAAVILLSALDPENQCGNCSTLDQVKKALTGVMKNPIILASVSAILLHECSIALPSFLVKLISSLASMATPLALITLGAQMTMESVKSDRAYVTLGTLCKAVVMPLIMVPAAYLLGIRGYEMATVFIVSASPSAVNSYMLAREMHSDEVLTGEIILFTTFFSMFVMFFGIYLLKAFAYIS